eukprot:g767.t1
MKIYSRRAILWVVLFLAMVYVNVVRACTSWNLVWYAPKWYEETYIPEQLLDGFDLRSNHYRDLRPQKHHKGNKSSAHEIELDYSKALEEELQNVQDCSIVVVRIRQFPKCKAAISIAKAYHGLRAFFVVLGEEDGDSCSACSKFYNIAPFVVRHYYDPACQIFLDDNKLLIIPMGTTSGTMNAMRRLSISKDKKASERFHVWSFASSHRNKARDDLVRFIRNSSAAIALSHRLRFPKRDNRYVETLFDSAFVFAPRGNVEDTWRLYEVVRSGAIPIVSNALYWSQFMPKDVVDEFLVVDCNVAQGCQRSSFDRVVAKMQSLVQDPAALNRRQERLLKAWLRFDDAWKAQMALLVSTRVLKREDRGL